MNRLFILPRIEMELQLQMRRVCGNQAAHLFGHSVSSWSYILYSHFSGFLFLNVLQSPMSHILPVSSFIDSIVFNPIRHMTELYEVGIELYS